MTLLSWVIQTYPGKELMADPMLRIPKDKVSPLLDSQTLENVQKEYLDVSFRLKHVNVILSVYKSYFNFDHAIEY